MSGGAESASPQGCKTDRHGIRVHHDRVTRGNVAAIAPRRMPVCASRSWTSPVRPHGPQPLHTDPFPAGAAPCGAVSAFLLSLFVFPVRPAADARARAHIA